MGVRDRYLSIIQNKGFLTNCCKIHRIAIINGFREYYGDHCLNLFQSGIEPGIKNIWLVNILRKHRKAFHPVRHFLLARYLAGSLANFIADKFENKVFIPIEKKSVPNPKINQDLRNIYRKRWSDTIKNNPDMIKQDLRVKMPKEFAWLYLYDRDWLKANSPEGRQTRLQNDRIDWEKRDEIELKALKIVFQKTLLKSIKPQRVTFSGLAKQTGLLRQMTRNPEKMPKSISYIDSVKESFEDFQIRRIKRAAEKIYYSGKPLSIYSLKRIAGLKTKCTNKVDNYLIKTINYYDTLTESLKTGA